MAEDEVRKYKMVGIGGSAGSLEVVLELVSALACSSGGSFVIVMHRKNDPDSILPRLLSARTTLAVKEVEDKEPILPNTIYLAPSGYHLLIEDEKSFSLDASEKVHYSRPSIDVTFASVAEIFGSAAIGVLLSGANADGAEGLQKIKEAGGFTIVQDPATAEVDYMPLQALGLGSIDAVLHPRKMAAKINQLLKTGK